MVEPSDFTLYTLTTPKYRAKKRDPIFALRMKGIEWVSPIGSPMR
jgi:hypothetical protein